MVTLEGGASPSDESAEADALFEEGFAAVERGDTDAGFQIADRLAALSRPLSLALKARAYHELDRPADSLRAAEEAVEAAPDSWLLLMMLGNSYVRVDRFQESFDAFERALRAENAIVAQVDYNYAVALRLAGMPARARARLDGIVMSEALKQRIPFLAQCLREERGLYRRKWFGLFG